MGNIIPKIKKSVFILNERSSIIIRKVKHYKKTPLIVLISSLMFLICSFVCYFIFPSPHEAFKNLFNKRNPIVAGTGDKDRPNNEKETVVNKCDNNSNFIDNENEWETDRWWTKENNSNSFIYRKSDRGGPRMTYCNKEIYNNFDISFKFSPISNDGNNLEEINLIIYVGNLYRIVFDQNRDINDKIKNTYLYVKDGNGKYIHMEDESEIKKEKIHLDNKIPFNRPSRIIIKQDCYEGRTEQFVTLSVEYTPDKLKNAKTDFKRITFEIEDSFCDNKNDFSIGLLNGRSEIIITEFDDFILNTYKD